jgi:hypothetical protein
VDGNGFVIVMDAGQRARAGVPRGRVVRARVRRAGSGPGQFNNPSGAGRGSAGRLLVLDKDNSRIQVFANLATTGAAPDLGCAQVAFPLNSRQAATARKRAPRPERARRAHRGRRNT